MHYIVWCQEISLSRRIAASVTPVWAAEQRLAWPKIATKSSTENYYGGMKGAAALLAGEMFMIRGKLNGHRKKWAEALQCFREALERFQKVTLLHPEVRDLEASASAQIGACLAAMGHDQDALAAFDRALQIRPDFFIVYAHLSSVLNKLGDTKTASEYLERALRNSPELRNPQRAARWHRQLGHMNFNLGDWTRAAENLRLAVKQKPDQYTYCNLAVALWHTGDKEGCLDAYKRATSLAPNDAEAHYGLGWAFYSLHRYTEAVAPLLKSIELDRSRADAHYNLGLALGKLGRTEEGLKSHREAARLRPEHPETHYAIGIALAEQKDFEGAIIAYRESIRLRPAYPEAHYNIGVAYGELGKLDEAIEAYKTAINFDEKKCDAWGQLGFVVLREADARRCVDRV